MSAGEHHCPSCGILVDRTGKSLRPLGLNGRPLRMLPLMEEGGRLVFRSRGNAGDVELRAFDGTHGAAVQVTAEQALRLSDQLLERAEAAEAAVDEP